MYMKMRLYLRRNKEQMISFRKRFLKLFSMSGQNLSKKPQEKGKRMEAVKEKETVSVSGGESVWERKRSIPIRFFMRSCAR